MRFACCVSYYMVKERKREIYMLSYLFSRSCWNFLKHRTLRIIDFIKMCKSRCHFFNVLCSFPIVFPRQFFECTIILLLLLDNHRQTRHRGAQIVEFFIWIIESNFRYDWIEHISLLSQEQRSVITSMCNYSSDC